MVFLEDYFTSQKLKTFCFKKKKKIFSFIFSTTELYVSHSGNVYFPDWKHKVLLRETFIAKKRLRYNLDKVVNYKFSLLENDRELFVNSRKEYYKTLLFTCLALNNIYKDLSMDLIFYLCNRKIISS